MRYKLSIVYIEVKSLLIFLLKFLILNFYLVKPNQLFPKDASKWRTWTFYKKLIFLVEIGIRLYELKFRKLRYDGKNGKKS